MLFVLLLEVLKARMQFCLFLYKMQPQYSFSIINILSHFQRLAAGEWFTARVSSCGLFHIAYPSAPEALKAELRTIYSQLCQDDMPMVRRAAATNLGKFAATVEAAHMKTDIMSMFEDLTQDGNLMSQCLYVCLLCLTGMTNVGCRHQFLLIHISMVDGVFDRI